MRSYGGATIGGAVTTETAWGSASNAGASLTAARSDHTHGTFAHDSHTNLTNIGTHTHPQIDSHLSDYTSDPHLMAPTGTNPDCHYTYSHTAHVLDTRNFDSGGGVNPTATGTGVLRGLQFSCDKVPTYKWIDGNPWTTGMYPTVQFWWECSGFVNSTDVHFFAFSDDDSLTNAMGFKWDVNGSGVCTMQGFVNVAGAQTTSNLATVSANTPYVLNGEVSGANWYATCNGTGGVVGATPVGKNYFIAWSAENVGSSTYWILRYPRFRVLVGTSVL